jgi:hypothetical protein
VIRPSRTLSETIDPSGTRHARYLGNQGDIEVRWATIMAWAYVSEVQRDGARAATAEQVTKLFAQRGGAFGQGLLWEWDLLNLKEGTR